MMSHDLKTPLNSIIGFSRRILNKDEALSDNSRKFLEIVLRNGQNLYDLIKSILDFGRLDVGNIKINKQKGSIKENLNYIFNSLLIQSQEKGLELNLSLDDNCDKIIEYDWLKFGQIISNLGQNAIKYSETGNIDISCSFVKEKQGFLVSVSDQGPGIKADDLKRMFEPFTQLDLKHYNKGTGLGLAIVKKLCDLLSIEISVESEISKGTQFNLYLGNPQ